MNEADYVRNSTGYVLCRRNFSEATKGSTARIQGTDVRMPLLCGNEIVVVNIGTPCVVVTSYLRPSFWCLHSVWGISRRSAGWTRKHVEP